MKIYLSCYRGLHGSSRSKYWTMNFPSASRVGGNFHHHLAASVNIPSTAGLGNFPFSQNLIFPISCFVQTKASAGNRWPRRAITLCHTRRPKRRLTASKAQKSSQLRLRNQRQSPARNRINVISFENLSRVTKWNDSSRVFNRKRFSEIFFIILGRRFARRAFNRSFCFRLGIYSRSMLQDVRIFIEWRGWRGEWDEGGPWPSGRRRRRRVYKNLGTSGQK